MRTPVSAVDLRSPEETVVTFPFRSSAAASAMSIPRDSDALVASRENCTHLLGNDSIKLSICHGTILTGKVCDLEEKFNAAIDTAEAEVAASPDERNGPLKENEFLLAQVTALSTRSVGASSMGGSDLLKTENLDELFSGAAAMDGSDSSKRHKVLEKCWRESSKKASPLADVQELKKVKKR